MNNFNNMWYKVNAATKGYLFEHKETGVRYRPFELFHEFYRAEDEYSIEKLMRLELMDYNVFNQKGWEDGIITDKSIFEKS